MYTFDRRTRSISDAPPPAPPTEAETRRALWYARALAEALAALRRAEPVRALALALLCLTLGACGGGSAEAPPTNAVGITGVTRVYDKRGPTDVITTIIVTGNGVRPAGGR